MSSFKKNSIWNWIFSISFVGMIFVPGLAASWNIISDSPPPRPSIVSRFVNNAGDRFETFFSNPEDYGHFEEYGRPQKKGAKKNLISVLPPPSESFEERFKRNLPFQERLDQITRKMLFNILNVRSYKKVVRGEENWLYLRDSVDIYRELKPYSKSEMKLMASKLLQRQKWFRERGATYIFVVVPAKSTIYPEYLPSFVKAPPHQGRLAQFREYIENNSDLIFLDLTDTLKEHKESGLLFYKSDTHWNARGAYLGYLEIMKVLKDRRFSCSSGDRSYVENLVSTLGGDLARLLKIEGWYSEETVYSQKKGQQLATRSPREPFIPEDRSYWYFFPFAMEQANLDCPRAVVMHDSFFPILFSFVSEHFSRISFYWQSGIEKDAVIDEEIFNSEKPQIVIEQVSERLLYSPPK